MPHITQKSTGRAVRLGLPHRQSAEEQQKNKRVDFAFARQGDLIEISVKLTCFQMTTA